MAPIPIPPFTILFLIPLFKFDNQSHYYTMKTTKHNTSIETSVKGTDVYTIITDRIIEQLSQGIIPWRKPWVGGDSPAVKYKTGEPYSLLNQFLLGKPGEWLAWGQIQELGGRVKKGEKSSMCVWCKTENKKVEVENENGEKEEKVEFRRYLKWYRVWHIDQLDGIPSKIVPVEVNPNIKPIDEAEAVINAYVEREKADGFSFVNNRESSSAYYSPSEDKVVVPMLSQYEQAEEYYSTTFHELTHSTMKATRCDRVNDNKNAAFGNEEYSREELVAEMGAAFLCNKVGLDNDKAFKNSVAYLQHWIKALQNDKKMISWAATRAAKAVDFIQTGKKPAENSVVNA